MSSKVPAAWTVDSVTLVLARHAQRGASGEPDRMEGAERDKETLVAARSLLLPHSAHSHVRLVFCNASHNPSAPESHASVKDLTQPEHFPHT